MAVANEAVGEGMVVVGILPMGEITKMMGLTTTRGAATIPMARAPPIVTGEIQGIGPSQHHVLSRMTPVT